MKQHRWDPLTMSVVIECFRHFSRYWNLDSRFRRKEELCSDVYPYTLVRELPDLSGRVLVKVVTCVHSWFDLLNKEEELYFMEVKRTSRL